MNDNAPKTASRFYAWLPVASLALSAAAFAFGAPVRLARSVRRARAERAESASLRDESVLFPMPASARAPRFALPVAGRDASLALGRAFAATR